MRFVSYFCQKISLIYGNNIPDIGKNQGAACYDFIKSRISINSLKQSLRGFFYITPSNQYLLLAVYLKESFRKFGINTQNQG